MNVDNSNAKIMLYIARLIQPMYGNNSSVKCVVNEQGDSAYVKDANLLLSLLDIEHPVAQMIVSVVSAHSHRYGSGVKSLVVMMAQLSEAYLSLLDQGLPRDVIKSLMRQIFGILMDKVKDLKLKIAETPQECEPIKAPLHLCTTDSSSGRKASRCQQKSLQGSMFGSPGSCHVGNHQCQCNSSAQPEEGAGMLECDALPAVAIKQEKSRSLVKLDAQKPVLSFPMITGNLINSTTQDTYHSTVKSENLVNCVAQDSHLCSPTKSGNLVDCDTQGSPAITSDGFFNYENFRCSGPINSDNCSSLNHQGEMSETRVVYLHMKVSEGGDEDEDDVDDVDWYFDRSVPKVADKDSDIPCASVRSVKTVCSDGQDLVSSLKDADQHDADFDDCFDDEDNRRDVILDGQRQMPDVKPLDTAINAAEVKSSNSLKHGGKGCRHTSPLKKEVNVLLGHENNITKRRLETCVDDDFNSCFDCEKDVQTSQRSPEVKSRLLQTCHQTLEETTNLIKFPSDENNMEKKLAFMPSGPNHRVNATNGQRGFTKMQTENVLPNHQDDTQNEETKTKQAAKVEAVSSKMDLKSLNSMLMTVQKKNENGRHKELDRKINVNFSSRHLNGLNDNMTTLDLCSDKNISGLVTSNKRLMEKEPSNGGHCEKNLRLKMKNESANSGNFEKLLLNKLADKSKQTVRSSLTHSRHFQSFANSQDNLALTNTSEQGLDSDSREGMGLSLGQASKDCRQSARSSMDLEQLDSSSKKMKHQASGGVSQGLLVKLRSANSSEQTPDPDRKINRAVTLDQQAGVNRTSSDCSDRVSELKEPSKEGPHMDCVEMNFDEIDESFKHSNLREISESTDETKHGPNSERIALQELSLHQVGAGLSRGCTQSMELVLQTALTQMRRRGVAQFNSNLMSTCVMSYHPSSMTGLIDGLVVECQTDLFADLRRETHINALLVNGDLSSSSHHQGYKNSTRGKHVIGPQAILEATDQDGWVQETLEALQQLSVTLVLVKGSADPQVKVALRSKGILVLERVTYRVLQALRETTGVELVVYVEDCSQINVCKRLTVQPCDQLWMDKLAANKEHTTHIVINTATPSSLQTVLICHPSSQQAELQEQEVMSCSRRLEAALHDGVVLPGGGCIEQFCSEYLIGNCEGMKTSYKNQPYVPVVAGALAEVFNNIVNMIGVDRPLLDTFQKTPQQNGKSKSVDDNSSGQGSKSIKNLVSSKRVSEEIDRNSDILVESDHSTRNCGKEFDHLVNFDDVEEVYDNFQSKMAAWNAAMDTVFMVSQTDAHIVTGVTSNDLKNGVFINGVVL